MNEPSIARVYVRCWAPHGRLMGAPFGLGLPWLWLLLPSVVTGCDRASTEGGVPTASSAPSASVAPISVAVPSSKSESTAPAPAALHLLAGAQRATKGQGDATVVELGTEGLDERLEIAEVKAPYVCSLRTRSAKLATVTCTPNFRKIVAELRVESDGLHVTLPNAKQGRGASRGSVAPQPEPTYFRPTRQSRVLELADSEVGARREDLSCKGARANAVTVRLMSVNYYLGYTPAAQLLLVVPDNNPIALIDQQRPVTRWWLGCNSRAESGEVRIECKRGEAMVTVARIWPEPGGVAFESSIPSPGYGKLRLPCAAPVSVTEPSCFACGNRYF